MGNISNACCFPDLCPDYFQVWLKQRMIEFQKNVKALEYCFSGRIENNYKEKYTHSVNSTATVYSETN